jgi:hypothetical protein
LVACKPVTDGASVQIADGTSCPITHKGSLCNTHFDVPNVSFVPQLSMNLLSVGQVTDHNCFVGFDDSSCFIQDRRSGRVIGTGHRRKGASSLYVLDTLRLPSSVGSPAHVSSAASSFAKWHHRLGHLCGSRLSSLINQGCLDHTSIESSFHCKGVNLENKYNFHIYLVLLLLLDLLILFILMYGVLHLLLQRVVTNIMFFLLMIILVIHGSIL